MNIHGFEVQRIRIPLRVRFAQSNQSTRFSDSVILQLRTGEGRIGYGECCPRPYVTGEDAASVGSDLRRILPPLLRRSFDSLAAVLYFLAEELPADLGPAARCALELALLDAWGKAVDTPLVELLGGEYAPEFQYSGVCPTGNAAATQQLLLQLHGFGFREIKLKIGTRLSDTLERIAWTKRIFGPEVIIRLDGNCAWELSDAYEQLPALIEAGVSNVEQAFAADRWDDFRKITAEFGPAIRISVDEALTTPEVARRLIDEQVCNQFNLKISKHGGILPSLEIHALAQEHGIGCQLGAHFGETSLLTAAGLIVASLAQPLSSLEGAFGEHLLEKDVCEDVLQFGQGGKLKVRTSQTFQAGLGVVVNPVRLQQLVEPFALAGE
jgi:muconate cycloisomerase